MKHPETAFITGIGGFIGARLAQRCASEDGPLRGEGNPYCQTKIESEQAVLALNDPPHFGVAALAAEAFGEAFNITDGRASTYLEFFGRLAHAANAPAPMVVPTRVMQLLTRIAHALAKRGLMSDDASPDTVRYLSRPAAYSIDKARRVLGYTPRIGLDEGLALTQPYIDTLQRT